MLKILTNDANAVSVIHGLIEEITVESYYVCVILSFEELNGFFLIEIHIS